METKKAVSESEDPILYRKRLDAFFFPRAEAELQGRYEWNDCDVQAQIANFKKNELLLPATSEGGLRGLNTKELKLMAKSHQLKVSGSKDDLVARLLTLDEDRLRTELALDSKYELSVLGKARAEKLRQDETDQKSAKLRLIHSLILAGKLEKAAQEGANESAAQEVKAIFDIPRTRFGEVPETDFVRIQAAAALALITGETNIREWLPWNVENLEDDPQDVAFSLISSAKNVVRIRQFRECGFKAVSILPSHLDGRQCSECLALENKAIPLEQIISVPLPQCDVACCGCLVTAAL